MSWEREPLWTKARLFFERAFDEPRDSAYFGLWCAMGLELLARASVASISPTLLADPDPEQRHLLHALGRGGDRVAKKSIGTSTVLTLCKTLFPAFTDDDFKASLALVNRRNEELHSGTPAFDVYPSKLWLAGFYSACKSLSESMGESLDSLFGNDEAAAANETLTTRVNDVKQRVNSHIAAYRKVFEDKPVDERERLTAAAKLAGDTLAHERHHRVACPACNSVATVQGHPVGRENVQHGDGEITVRRSIAPDTFQCTACGLKLDNYSELDVAGLGGHYTRRTIYTPEEYYGLIDPDSADMDELIRDYMERRGTDYDDYDNE